MSENTEAENKLVGCLLFVGTAFLMSVMTNIFQAVWIVWLILR